MSNRFHVGDEIHGFAGGYFGRDSYDCRLDEAVGRDWIVTRNTNGEAEFVAGSRSLSGAWFARSGRAYCDYTCEATP